MNVVDLFRLQPENEHPHGLSDRDFDGLFTRDRPIILNFHGYPWLVHRLAYRRTNHGNLHVRGYKERGSISTPFELAIENQIDRFSLAIDVIDRVPGSRRPAPTPRSASATFSSRACATPASRAWIPPRSATGCGPCEQRRRGARDPALFVGAEHVDRAAAAGGPQRTAAR